MEHVGSSVGYKRHTPPLILTNKFHVSGLGNKSTLVRVRERLSIRVYIYKYMPEIAADFLNEAVVTTTGKCFERLPILVDIKSNKLSVNISLI